MCRGLQVWGSGMAGICTMHLHPDLGKRLAPGAFLGYWAGQWGTCVTCRVPPHVLQPPVPQGYLLLLPLQLLHPDFSCFSAGCALGCQPGLRLQHQTRKWHEKWPGNKTPLEDPAGQLINRSAPLPYTHTLGRDEYEWLKGRWLGVPGPASMPADTILRLER